MSRRALNSAEQALAIQVTFLQYDPRAEVREKARQRIRAALAENTEALARAGCEEQTIKEVLGQL